MIRSIYMENMMGFEQFSNPVAFPGITVILGKNDVCKTALMKMMYAVGKATETYNRMKAQNEKPVFRNLLSDKVQSVYGIKNALGDLVRKNGAPKRLSVQLSFESKHPCDVLFAYGTDTRTSITNIATVGMNGFGGVNYVFIPAKEVLTAFNTIKAVSRQLYYPGWDDTTLDLIDLLDIPVASEVDSRFDEVLQKIREMFSGELKQISSNERFVYKRNGAEYALPLTAEGIKHIGVLSTLISNGQIKKGTVLFLDEPEDNLHPNALRQLMKVLVLLVNNEVQVFLTTHNYFTLKQLQIEARTHQMDIMCCELHRNSQGVVDSSFANLREAMPDNEIVRESLAMLDEDIAIDFMNK